jgi:hypothetical protein
MYVVILSPVKTLNTLVFNVLLRPRQFQPATYPTRIEGFLDSALFYTNHVFTTKLPSRTYEKPLLLIDCLYLQH